MAQKHGVLSLCAARAALGSLESPRSEWEGEQNWPVWLEGLCLTWSTRFMSTKRRLYKNLLPSLFQCFLKPCMHL